MCVYREERLSIGRPVEGCAERESADCAEAALESPNDFVERGKMQFSSGYVYKYEQAKCFSHINISVLKPYFGNFL